VETHISHLFLTGSHVYKVKKPVDYGFLDFTTLAGPQVLLRTRGGVEPPYRSRCLSGRGRNTSG
jgi:hypothetical protein